MRLATAVGAAVIMLALALAAGACTAALGDEPPTAARQAAAVLLPDLGVLPEPTSELTVVGWQQVVALRPRARDADGGPLVLVSCAPAPSGVVLTVAGGTALDRALPLNTPVSISISETGGGSSGTATIVACSDGTAWSWIGLNGTGAVAKGVNVATANTAMSTTGAGQWVHTVSAAAGTVRISSTAATPVRAYINY